MAELAGTKTQDSLERMHEREAGGELRLTYFARIAAVEGHHELAQTLREIAELERVIAEGHLDFLRAAHDPATGLSLGDTRSNLLSLLASEREDATGTYPRLAKTAKAEGFPDIASWFDTLAKAKGGHVARLSSLLERLG